MAKKVIKKKEEKAEVAKVIEQKADKVSTPRFSPKIDPIDGKKILDTPDLMSIESCNNDAMQAKLLMHIYEQELAKMKLELEIKQRDIQSQIIKLNQQTIAFKSKNEKVAKLLEAMRIRYGVKGEFGYDPLSGKIAES